MPFAKYFRSSVIVDCRNILECLLSRTGCTTAKIIMFCNLSCIVILHYGSMIKRVRNIVSD